MGIVDSLGRKITQESLGREVRIVLWRVATFILFLWHPVELFAAEKSRHDGKKAGFAGTASAPIPLPITTSELSAVLEVAAAYEWLLAEQNKSGISSQADQESEERPALEISYEEFPEFLPFLHLYHQDHHLILSPEVLLACGMEMETFMLVGLILTSNISSCVINNSLRDPRQSGDAEDESEVIWRPKLAR